MESKRIIVLAYALSPTRGSEYSVAWNYVKYMSQNNQLTVLYGIAGDHMGDIEELENFVVANPMPNVKFVPVKPNWWANALNWLNRHDMLVYTFYFAYDVWQKLAYKAAKKLIEAEQFDLIHYVGPIGYREPGYLWKLNIPYMWGPIGGTPNVNPKLTESLTRGGKVKQGVRAFLNSFQLKYNSRVKKAIRRADLLLTATTENQAIIKKQYGVDSIYIPENAIEKCYPLNQSKFENIDKIELIFVGHVDSRKSVITILKALTKVKNKESVRLNIVGGGPLIESLKQFCSDNNIAEMVKWHGKVNRDEVFNLMNNAHLHVITSVMEANTTVIFEAMSKGIPTLSLDQCGMHDTICEKCGFLINIDSIDQITTNIASIIDQCVADPTILERKAEGVLECRAKHLWSNRVERMNEFYDMAITNYNKYAINRTGVKRS